MINTQLAAICIGGLFLGIGLAKILSHPSRLRKPRAHGQKKGYYSYLDIIMHPRHWGYIKENPTPFVTTGLIGGVVVIGIAFAAVLSSKI